MVDVLVVSTDIICLVMNVTSKYQYLARTVRVMRIARMARAARLVRRLHDLREESMRDRVATYSIGKKVRVVCRHRYFASYSATLQRVVVEMSINIVISVISYRVFCRDFNVESVAESLVCSGLDCDDSHSDL